jgi:ankyrin repeat protein
VVEVLLAAGAEVDANRSDNNGRVLSTCLTSAHLLFEAAHFPHACFAVFASLPSFENGSLNCVLTLTLTPTLTHTAEGTPLHFAIENGSVDCVRLLLEAGANPSHTRDSAVLGDGATPFHTLVWFEYVAEYLQDIPTPSPPLPPPPLPHLSLPSPHPLASVYSSA